MSPFMRTTLLVLAVVLGSAYLLVRLASQMVAVNRAPVSSSAAPATSDPTLEIVTLLPKDAIQAIDAPRFYTAAEADREYAPDELVLGVSLNGDSRAYSTALLSAHEIVNDTVGGHKLVVTW